MKPSGFGIIELLETIILPEVHAMNKSITQATQNDKQISKSIKRFFTRFHIFSNRSMYMSLLTGKNTPDFAKV